jgi:hypothetical protein
LLQASVECERAEKWDAKYYRQNLEDAKKAIREALSAPPQEASEYTLPGHAETMASLDALTIRPQDVRSPEDEAEHFIQAAIDDAPEPLQRLGEFLADVLDEDHWKAAERMLLALAVMRRDQSSGEPQTAPNCPKCGSKLQHHSVDEASVDICLNCGGA